MLKKRRYELWAGYLAGMLVILYFTLFYFFDKKLMLSGTVYWSSVVFYILAMLGACLLEKRRNEGILSFRKAVQMAFTTFVVANVLYFVFFYLMFNVVDPGLPDLQKEIYQEYYQSRYTGPDLRKALESLEKTDLRLTPGYALLEFARGAMGGFVLALLLALAVRQEAE